VRSDSSCVVGEDLVHGAKHVILIFLGHRREERQGDKASLDGPGHRAKSRGVAEPLPVEGVTVDERIVDCRPDVLGAQGLQDRIAVHREAIEAEQDNEEVPAMPQSVRKSGELDDGRAVETLAIAAREPVTSLPEALELRELREAERRLKVGEPVVVSRLGDLVTPGARGGSRSARSSRSVSTAPPSPVVISFTG